MKRIFRAREKINEPDTISHITQRAPGKELLFLEKEDFIYMLHLIKENVAKFSLKIFAFTLMPNHIHLLLQQTTNNLCDAMKNLFEKYANYFNVKYQRKGHVFCGAYKQAVCLDENYLFTITVYIHVNAVRAGLVANPLDYPWTSIRPYVMSIGKETFLNYEYILQMLDTDIEKAREIYRGLMEEALNIKSMGVLESARELYSFKTDLNKIISNIFHGQIKQMDIFEIDLGKKIEELKSRQRLRSPQEIEARRYLIQQLISRGYKISEIAEKLGVSRQSIHANLTKQAMLKM